MGSDQFNKGYFSSGPQNNYEAQQGQHHRREQERARQDEQRRQEDQRRSEEQLRAEQRRPREQPLQFPPILNPTRNPTGNYQTHRGTFSASRAGSSKAGWLVFGGLILWWISASLITLALEKIGVGQALASKIGWLTLPVLLALAFGAVVSWILWTLLKAVAAWYVAHRKVTHAVVLFAALLAASQLAVAYLTQLAGVDTGGTGLRIFAFNLAVSALGTWLSMRKLPHFFR